MGCSTSHHEPIPPEAMCVRVMMHAQRISARRSSGCSQLSAFVGSNMLPTTTTSAEVLAWLGNPVLSPHVPHSVEAHCFELVVPDGWEPGASVPTTLVLPDGTRVAAVPSSDASPGGTFRVSVPVAALRALGTMTVVVHEDDFSACDLASTGWAFSPSETLPPARS